MDFSGFARLCALHVGLILGCAQPAGAQPAAPVSGPTLAVDQIEVDASGKCAFANTPQVQRLASPQGTPPYSIITQPAFNAGSRQLLRSAAVGGAQPVSRELKIFSRADLLGSGRGGEL